MRIGDVAAQTGLTTDAIRYYEKEGLLTPPRRTGNGYRDYSAEAVGDLKFIKKAQLVGLRLSDIREVLAIVSGGRPAPRAITCAQCSTSGWLTWNGSSEN